jgi:predicted dehydrogenase
MTTVLRWGFIGAGAIADLVAADLANNPNHQIVAVTSRSIERASAFAARNGCIVDASVEGLLTRLDVDAVYIATPPATHADYAVAALNAGKHVLVEKPFATSAYEARRIVAAAELSQRFCMEAMWTRFLPAIERALAEVRNGVIGEVRQLTADFAYAVTPEPSHHLFTPGTGGALLDRGVYGVSLACAVLGAPSSVHSSAWIGTTGVDEDVTVSMTHASGASSVTTASIRTRGVNEAVIRGTGGTLVLAEPFFAPSQYRIIPAAPQTLRASASSNSSSGSQDASSLAKVRSRVEQSPLGRRALATAKGVAKAGVRELRAVTAPFVGHGYGHQFDAVRYAIQTGKLESDVMTLADSQMVMEAMDRARSQWSADN